MKLSIAGFPVWIESADKEWFAQRFADYVREDDRPPVMEMCTRLLDVVPLPEGELVEQINAVKVVRLTDGRVCRYTQGRSGRVLYAIYHNEDYSRVDIQLCSSRNHPQFSNRDFEYMYTGFSIQNRMTTLGAGVLHSSCLAWRGNGVAFSANSGTGKSTQVGLWKQYFGDEVDIINDDKPIIRFEGEQPLLCGAPWSGKTALNCNKLVPLKAIVFLERGEKNSIRRLNSIESLYWLSSQIARPFHDAELGAKVMDFTERVLASVPVYLLTCNISKDAVLTAAKTIFPQEEIHI